ncbi:MAG TPA: hypothetical protein VJK09_00735 [Candidatus Paceibacterota bacterium]
MNNPNNSKIFLVILLVLAIVGCGYFAAKASRLDKQVAQLQQEPRISLEAGKTLVFMKDFIANVIGASTEVDFDTRLRLENEVRDLNDAQILTNWKDFIASKTEKEAQEQVLKILQRLIIVIEQGAGE